MNIQNSDDQEFFFDNDNSYSSQKVDLIQDIKTRWESSNKMIKRVWELKKIIQK